MNYDYLRPGIGNAASYQASGIPWYTSSLAPALSTTSVVINLPQVTKFVTIKNTSTTGDSLRFTFNNNSVVDNQNYVLLESGESFSADFRVTDIHLISDSETPVPFTIVNGLTNIRRQEMTSTTPTPPNLLAWAQKQKILHTDENETTADDRLGYGFETLISTDDNSTLIASSMWDDENGDNAGASFVFKKVGEQYLQVQKITASGGDPTGDRLGSTQVITPNGEKLVISAYADSDRGTGGGSAYVFHNGSEGYYQVQKITSSATNPAGDYFGWGALAIDQTGNKIVIGARGADPDGVSKGAVYVFESGSVGFQEVQILTSSTAVVPQADSFGSRIAMTTDTTKLFIVARNERDLEPNTTGSLYVFESGSVGYEQKQSIPLTNFNPGGLLTGDLSISEDGSVVVVGNGYDGRNGANSGVAYVLKEVAGTYSIVQELTQSDSIKTDDSFGFAVSLNASGDTLCIASRYDQENGTEAGAAYIFKDNGSGFAEMQKLAISDPDNSPEGDLLGYDCHLNGDTLFVAAPYDEVANQGSIYVFKYTRDY